MAEKIKKKLPWAMISLLALGIVAFGFNLAVEKVKAAAVTSQVTVTGEGPTISLLQFNNSSNAITLESWATADGTTTVTTTFRVTDNNGWGDISSTTIFVYRSGVVTSGNCSTSANDNINNCYPPTSTDNVWSPYYGTYPNYGYTAFTATTGCAITATDTSFIDFWCTTTLRYTAEATDAANAGYDYSAQNWVVFASTSDKGGITDNDTATAELSTSRNIIVDLSTINYSNAATLTAGSNTGTSWTTTTVTTTGNVVSDVHFDGGNLTATGKVAIKAYNQRFTTTTGANKTFGDEGTFQLSTSTDTVGQLGYGKTHDLTMRKPTTTVPGPTTADKVIWGVAIPALQPADTYSSTTNLTATSTIIAD